LRAPERCLELWREVFKSGPTRLKIRTFTPQNLTSSSSKRQRAKNFWRTLTWTEEQREEVTRLIGAVLPLALAHHEGGARKGSESAGPWQFITTNCPDAVQPS
ncbi:unnamed protein product, partial [Pylaiella littoralis]